MTVYQPLVAQNFEWINCEDPDDYEVFARLDGTPRAATWKPIRVRRVRADDRQGFEPSDFPWLGSHALVMRRKALDALRDVLDAHGEVLPLSSDVELFVFNSRCVDALDEAASSVQRFPGTNRIMRIKRAVFVESAVRELDVFRLPHRASPTYVSERFVARVTAAALVGLEFKTVWSA